MKNILLVFIAFFVFASCKEDNSISNENEYIFAYLLNSKSDFISIIGTKDNNDNLQEINKLNLNGNQYPIDIDFLGHRGYFNEHIAISISGEEINSDNYGKIWKTNSSNKILLYNGVNGNLFQEIQLDKIAYNIQYIGERMILVGQSGENESSILTYIGALGFDDDEYFLEEEFKLNGSLTEFLYISNTLVCYFPNESKLKIYRLSTKELLKEIFLEGKPKTISLLPFNREELGILDINNKKVNLLNLENLSYVNILNLDFVPSDFLFMENYNEISFLDEYYLFISNPLDGNIFRFIKTNETWTKSGNISATNGIIDLDIPNCSSSIFYAISTINNSFISIDPFGFNKIKNIPITGKSPSKIASKCN